MVADWDAFCSYFSTCKVIHLNCFKQGLIVYSIGVLSLITQTVSTKHGKNARLHNKFIVIVAYKNI